MDGEGVSETEREGRERKSERDVFTAREGKRERARVGWRKRVRAATGVMSHLASLIGADVTGDLEGRDVSDTALTLWPQFCLLAPVLNTMDLMET